MKFTFKIKGKDSRMAVKIAVSIDTKSGVYTRSEARNIKESLENKIHQVLREENFHVREITLEEKS